MNRSHQLLGSTCPALLGVALALALALAGCGGGSGTTASSVAVSPTPAASPMELAADAVCKRLNSHIVLYAKPTTKQIVSAATRNAVLELAAVNELAKLTPPSALAASWQQILAYRRTLARQLVTLAHDESANDTKATNALTTSKLRVHSELRLAAARFGVRECAQLG
jgi:hypothetical protein